MSSSTLGGVKAKPASCVLLPPVVHCGRLRLCECQARVRQSVCSRVVDACCEVLCVVTFKIFHRQVHSSAGEPTDGESTWKYCCLLAQKLLAGAALGSAPTQHGPTGVISHCAGMCNQPALEGWHQVLHRVSLPLSFSQHGHVCSSRRGKHPAGCQHRRQPREAAGDRTDRHAAAQRRCTEGSSRCAASCRQRS